MEAALELLSRFLAEHPREAALELESIQSTEAAAILADQPPGAAAGVWQQMTLASAGDALARMEFAAAAALLCRLPTARAVALLFRQGLPLRLSLIQACPEPWKTSLSDACKLTRSSVGSLLSATVTVASSDWTIAKTRRYLAEHPERTSFEIFVVDREWRLTGRTDLHRLAIHTEARLLGGIVDPNPASLRLRTSIAAIRDDRLWQRFDVLPVTDAGGLLVGAVAHRSIRSLQGAQDGSSHPDQPGAGTALVDAAELAWTGYLAALNVAALLWRSTSAPAHGPEREPPDEGTLVSHDA